jgi:hypothetical protein
MKFVSSMKLKFSFVISELELRSGIKIGITEKEIKQKVMEF